MNMFTFWVITRNIMEEHTASTFRGYIFLQNNGKHLQVTLHHHPQTQQAMPSPPSDPQTTDVYINFQC